MRCRKKLSLRRWESKKWRVQAAEFRDQVYSHRKERDEMRISVVRERGEALARQQAAAHRRRRAAAADGAATRLQRAELEAQLAPPRTDGTGDAVMSPAASDDGQDDETTAEKQIGPMTWKQVAESGITKRSDLPSELQRRLRRADSRLAKFVLPGWSDKQ